MKECPICRTCFADDIVFCPDDGVATTSSIMGEPILDGRYQLEKRLGQGGMGIVFKARHIFLKTQHAIKIILPDLVGNDPNLITRFRQEALAAAAIRHQNIIAVTDFGVVRGTMPFLVMEFVQGKSLQDVMSEEGAMGPVRAFELIQPICAGIAAAHRQKIVHRDLKPLNVMIQEGIPTAEGAKLLDFGLAKIKSGELLGSFVAAQTTGLMGSPFYMAPEQWSDEPPDARADVYSLGVMLYQMLCGDVPFKGSSIPSIMKKHLTTEVPPMASHGVQVPPQIEAVVRHALEKDPQHRINSADDFLSELRAAMEAASAVLKTTGDSAARIDPFKTIATPPMTTPPAGVQTTSDPLAGTISGTTLEDEEEKLRVAREELAREEEARRQLAAEAERKQKEDQARREAESQQRLKQKQEEEQREAARLEEQRREAARLESEKRAAEEREAEAQRLRDEVAAGEPVEEGGNSLENAQFTVYRPNKIQPQKLYRLLAYAHLSESEPNSNQPDPIEQIKEDVKQTLGEVARDYRPVTEDSQQPIPRQGEISFVPSVPGIEFMPRSCTFRWDGSVHREEFGITASREFDGRRARGSMSVFWGAILVAEINLCIEIDSASAAEPTFEREPPSRPYRRIFPSYARKDLEIVEQIKEYAQITGDKYLQDLLELRAGENWKDWMKQAIESADIFQLFWSSNSMRSANVKLEWQHALSLAKPNFIRPTYWENPFPESTAENLPPAELRDLHFQHVRPPQRTGRVPAEADQTVIAVAKQREREAQRLREKKEEARRLREAEEDARRKEEQRLEEERRREEERKRIEELVAQQTKAIEERLTKLAASFPPKTAELIDPEATQVRVPPGATTVTENSYPTLVSPPAVVAPPKRNLMLVVLAVVIVLVLGGGGFGLWLVKSFRTTSGPPITPSPGVSPSDDGKPPDPVFYKPEFVMIPAGTFQMGRTGATVAEVPVHAVTVKPFYIDKNEVTNAEYEQFVKATGHEAPSNWVGNKPIAGQELLPVTFVSYSDANAFAAWRSKRDGVQYRLPTEEEWEYAARGGNQNNIYPWGNTWVEGNAITKSSGATMPRPVGSAPNDKTRWGVMDMQGNVYEWTSTRATYYPGSARQVEGEHRNWYVVRGASYGTEQDPKPISATRRDWFSEDTKVSVLGFRLVRPG